MEFYRYEKMLTAMTSTPIPHKVSRNFRCIKNNTTYVTVRHQNWSDFIAFIIFFNMRTSREEEEAQN